MKRKVEMEEDSLFSQTDMAPAKKKKIPKTAPSLRPAEEAAAHAWKEKSGNLTLQSPPSG